MLARKADIAIGRSKHRVGASRTLREGRNVDKVSKRDTLGFLSSYRHFEVRGKEHHDLHRY